MKTPLVEIDGDEMVGYSGAQKFEDNGDLYACECQGYRKDQKSVRLFV
jgi:hypothetical protein